MFPQAVPGHRVVGASLFDAGASLFRALAQGLRLSAKRHTASPVAVTSPQGMAETRAAPVARRLPLLRVAGNTMPRVTRHRH